MKKLIFLIVLMLVPVLSYGQIIITGGGGSSPLVIGGRIAVSSPGGLLIVSGSVTRANTKLSAVDGTAFVDFSTANVLTNYAPKSKLTVTDSAGKKLVGYIKAAGTGETLGSELITNGGFDTDTVWTKHDGWSIDGGKAVKVVGTGNGRCVYQTAPLSLHGCYLGSFDTEAVAAAALGMSQILSGTDNQLIVQWHQSTGTKTGYATALAGGNVIIGVHSEPWGTATIDNVSLKQLLTPSVTGVTITSTPDGTTYNWASKEAGFNYNAASGYTYTIERE